MDTNKSKKVSVLPCTKLFRFKAVYSAQLKKILVIGSFENVCYSLVHALIVLFFFFL